MDLTVDFQSGIPIYEQVAQGVRELIERGALAPGSQLPTVRQLAVQLGINFNTVARAYRILDQEGVISTQHGRGTFLLEQKDRIPEQEREKIEELTRFYIRKAAHLGFKPEEIKDCLNAMVQDSEAKKRTDPRLEEGASSAGTSPSLADPARKSQSG